MESPTAKRSKMSDHQQDESTQTSSDTEEIGEDEICSTYRHHYNRPQYIDKTLLIKELFKNTEKHLLITAPSRFGKTLNMDMVRKFVEIEVDKDGERIKPSESKNLKMFEGKKISYEKEIVNKYFGQYPTIYVNFRSVKADTYEGILDRLRQAINEAFQLHPYLVKGEFWNNLGHDKEIFMRYFSELKAESLNLRQVETGLKKLSKYLHSRYGKPVYVFIDEFDEPVNSMIYDNEMTPGDKNKAIKLIQRIISNLFKDNMSVVRSLSNACQQLGGIFSGDANHVKVCRFLQEKSFAEFYGFKEDEVKSLLTISNKYDQFETVKSKYDGYLTKSSSGEDINLYSPYAVIQYIESDEYQDDWSAGIHSTILKLISHPKIEAKLLDLIEKKEVEISYVKKWDETHVNTLCRMLCNNIVDNTGVDLFIQFLYAMGFFYPVGSLSPGRLKLKIPNSTVADRIRLVWYDCHLNNKYHSSIDKRFSEALDNMAKSCNDETVLVFAQCIEDLFKDITTGMNECLIQCLLFHYIQQNGDLSGVELRTDINTRCDIILIFLLKSFGIIIELKSFSNKSMTSEKGHEISFVKEYFTLLDELSIERVFEICSVNLSTKVLMCMHLLEDRTVSSTYSIGPNYELTSTVSTKKKPNMYIIKKILQYSIVL